MTASYDSPSVIYVTDTAVGYPEIVFFHDAFMMPKISAANQALFQDIKLYNDT